jgi:hypothetical protein
MSTYSNTYDNNITFLDAMLYTMEGQSPSKAIENQEKRGQNYVVRNCRLPKKANTCTLPNEVFFKNVKDDMTYEERSELTTQNSINYVKDQYEKMGIEILDENDDLFWNVKLPAGWEIRATEHSMWNNLFDDKGRKRANFFYKAAFYDRDAFINFDTRFHAKVEHVADPSEDYEIWKASDYQGTVRDGENLIYCTECIPASGSFSEDDLIKEKLQEDLNTFMNKHYPDYKNINAYWD